VASPCANEVALQMSVPMNGECRSATALTAELHNVLAALQICR
jgi:hypothetical protein